ncbi:MAG TPA: bifunctional 4-hydroxy-2-oxoglutarate aldolase/2-dehydro-3-deoxy-phosphogluconate aldolase [Jiangellales bacterium]|nr:bifunctional 4-hydroxy-2-oxoglutarate aldolase/2-dehydro-3-deoxy-phosphogluconate aldolase [Jiangellales bacterium]
MSPATPDRTGFDAAMSGVPVIAIVRLPEAIAAAPLAVAVHRGGIRLIEVTLTTVGALDAVQTMREAGLDGLSVGVGSVRTAEDVHRSIDAGAEFLVTPTTNLDVLQAARQAGLPAMCGGLTPTELETAHRAGSAYVKLFPASALGPRYLREVLAPLPELRIIPTGGVDVDTIAQFKAAGAVGVGVGSALVDPQTVLVGDWPLLERRAEALVSAWHG